MTHGSRDSFEHLVELHHPEVDQTIRQRLGLYYQAVVDENQHQNLTRLIDPQRFYEGHFLDAHTLVGAKLIEGTALDLGSGAGVPGMIAALLDPRPWVLCDSEKRKAQFLVKVTGMLELQSSVTVTPQRAEAFLVEHSVQTIVSRAVGSLEQHLKWLGMAPGWRSLVLFKGPRWAEEKRTLARLSRRFRIELEREVHYEIGPERKKRTLIRLTRACWTETIPTTKN